VQDITTERKMDEKVVELEEWTFNLIDQILKQFEMMK
jgi:hypothetical protein